MSKELIMYDYNGPVLSWGTVIASHWEASTMASSKEKALNNLAYRYKVQNGFTRDYKIELCPDKIVVH